MRRTPPRQPALPTPHPTRTALAALLAAHLQCLALPAQAGGVFFRQVDLPLQEATAINNAGQVVGWNFSPDPGDARRAVPRAVLWSPALDVIDVAPPNNPGPFMARAISDPVDDLRQVVYIAGDRGVYGATQIFMTSRDGLSGTRITQGHVGVYQRDVSVGGVNSSGTVVGGGRSGLGHPVEAFVRPIDSLPTPLLDAATNGNGGAMAINNAGQVAGWSKLGTATQHAVVLQGASVLDLGSQPLLAGLNSQATAISQNGWVAGRYTGNPESLNIQWNADGVSAFIYHDGVAQRIAGNLSDGRWSHATGVNNSGQAAGNFRRPGSGNAAFFYSSASGAVDLNTVTLTRDSLSADITRINGINNLGQMVGYRYDREYDSQAVLLNPEGTLSWAKLRGGSVANPDNWDSGLGFAPNRLLDVVIASRTSQTVSADTSFDALSLRIGNAAGSAQNGRLTLALSNGIFIDPGKGLLIEGSGNLQGHGTVIGGAVVLNRGQVTALPGQLLALQGGLDNRGLVTGNGRIEANLLNRGGGAAGVQVGAGQHLTLAGTVHSMADGSHARVQDGGTLAFQGRLVNQGGATIEINRGVLQLGYGSQRLDNGGQLLVGSGRAEILGHVFNGPRGLVHARDGADLTVWDPLVNDGEVRATTGARIVYALGVSGKGSFTGLDGMHRFEGGYAPGHSPARVEMGNVQFASLVTMELGGLTAGSQHDRIDFSGSVRFEETSFLQINLINGFTPHAGDQFSLFSYTQAPVGNFEDFYLPTLAQGLSWDVSQVHTTGLLSVSGVPEPQTWALWLAGLVGLGALGQRRASIRGA